MGCAPDLPFGCAETWGRPIPRVYGYDARQHICNREVDHEGICKCSCGDTHEREAS